MPYSVSQDRNAATIWTAISAVSVLAMGIANMIDERTVSVVVTALATAAAGYFGVTGQASQKQGELNRDANWSCRDQLVQITTERDEWIERYLVEDQK